MARLAPSDAARLKLKWAFGFPGATRSVAQPTVFGGRVFVGSQNGKVYALDAKSGCTYWQFEAGKLVRAAIVIGPRGDNWAAYFGDAGANVYAIDALTGKMLWTTKVDQHPAAVITGSPTLVGTTLFVPVSSYEEAKARDASYGCCTFRGSVVALDAASGKIVWKTYTIAQEAKPGPLNAAGVQLMGPSGAAIWSAPTYDSAIQKTLCDDRRQLLGPDDGDVGCFPRLWRRLRRTGVDAADHLGRRFHYGLPEGDQLPQIQRTGR